MTRTDGKRLSHGVNFEWGTKTYVMGIINLTPDSFSGDGIEGVAAAVAQGRRLEAEGADILDIGGESTRPASTPITLEEELARVIPAVEALRKAVHIPISIDTYKAEVARQAIAAGAQMVNDVWAGCMEPDILNVAAKSGVPIVLMHNRSEAPARGGSALGRKDVQVDGKLGGRYVGVEYDDVLSDIKKELQERILAARAAGVRKENIIIDPGIGFGKTVEQNLELVRRLDELKTLGHPILVGPSRKSFVGYTLNLSPD
ncbi:MAG TPA: dihydropteroate synthase, partial [Candidatus Paceibacterota bacterium]